MSEYAPPSGPPPPKVPEGWKAVWNQQYGEWFFVNLHTKESTWEKPTAPATATSEDAPPGGPPPSYSAGGNAPKVSDTKSQPLQSNNPYQDQLKAETDEEMAKRLQAEEDARHRGGSDRGQADSYYGAGQTQPGSNLSPNDPQLPPRPTSGDRSRSGGGGLFGKLKQKLGGPGGSGGYPQQPQGYGGGYPQQQQYGPPQGYGGYPQQQGYGGYPPQGYGGYPQQGYGQPMYAQQPQRRKAGLGTGGAAALGVGGGLLGGMLLADAIDDHDDHEYDQGYQDGQDQDYGGGDMGGDMGGGDF